jgi:hypothetical protein
MSGPIDFRTLPANVPVMCIPRVFPNIDEKRIRGIFDELNMGEIDHIDIVGKTTEKGEKFNRVFVHFRKWHSNANADTARERLINGKEIKIIYDEPWFWKISAYRSQENPQRPQRPQTQRPQQQPRPQPRLQFDDEETDAKTLKDEFGRDQRPTSNQNQRPTSNQNQRPTSNQIQRPQQQSVAKPNNQKKPALPLAPALPMPVKKRDIRATKKQQTPEKQQTPAKQQTQEKLLEEGEVEEN